MPGELTYCTTKPHPGDHLTAPCAACGHATVLHVGVDHCPVCELVDLNAKAREGLAKGLVEISVNGRLVDERHLADLLARQMRRHGPASFIR